VRILVISWGDMLDHWVKSRLDVWREAEGVDTEVAVLGDSPPIQSHYVACHIRSQRELDLYLSSKTFDAANVLGAHLGLASALESAKFQGAIVHDARGTGFLKWVETLEQWPSRHMAVAPSRCMQERILSEFPRDKALLSFVRMGLDTATFHYSQPGRIPSGPVFLWAGELDEESNWRDYLTLAAIVGRQLPNALFWLIGGGGADESTGRVMLQAAAEYAPIHRFRWIHTVPAGQLHRCYSLAAASGGCLVTTSTGDYSGAGAIQALACRCPVVAAKGGAMPELLSGPLAELVFAPDQPDEAAAVMLRLVRDYAWREQIQAIGETLVRQDHDVRLTALQYLGAIKEARGAAGGDSSRAG